MHDAPIRGCRAAWPDPPTRSPLRSMSWVGGGRGGGSRRRSGGSRRRGGRRRRFDGVGERLFSLRLLLRFFFVQKLVQLLLSVGVVGHELADVERQERRLVAPLHHRELAIPTLDRPVLKNAARR